MSPRAVTAPVTGLLVGLLLALAAALAGCEATSGAPPPAGTATSPAPPGAASDGPAPVRSAAPIRLGFAPLALRRLVRDARRAGSSCLLVSRNGVVAGEWYWRGGSADRPQEVYSVTKSVTSTLVGIAQADGDLSLDAPAARYIPQWRGTASAGVTVRDLLSNDSGREWSVETDYAGLLGADDRTAYAVGLGQDAPPGTVWAYNNAAIQTLDRVLRSATGSDPASYAAERLFGPLGMTETRMTSDASGRADQVFFGMQSTCRDLERFGRLFLQRGGWEGRQVVPASWVRAAVGQPSQDLNAAYGLLWWLNQEGTVRRPLDAANPGLPPGVAGEDQLVPGAPEEMFAALGFGGQVVLVDPDSGTIVVRLGAPRPRGAAEYSVRDAARVVTEALRR
ncbi:serine hydrolase domain-containing protein [Nocardioides sp. YIM 152588]|uniref:serine hydrolase domain-containing protein n=1 Tax=Nocardioides sp. YIM 152588 TaxID=3158259 RepID=UPI0032E46BB3